MQQWSWLYLCSIKHALKWIQWHRKVCTSVANRSFFNVVRTQLVPMLFLPILHQNFWVFIRIKVDIKNYTNFNFNTIFNHTNWREIELIQHHDHVFYYFNIVFSPRQSWSKIFSCHVLFDILFSCLSFIYFLKRKMATQLISKISQQLSDCQARDDHVLMFETAIAEAFLHGHPSPTLRNSVPVGVAMIDRESFFWLPSFLSLSLLLPLKIWWTLVLSE